MQKWIANNEVVLMLVVLASISAVTYMPLVGQIGYVNDDWYLMYSAGAYGPEAFIDIFSVDRPARALVMMPAYTVFGENPIYYNLSAYVFRLISAFAFYWLLRMLFPDEKKISLIGSLLYLIYPGFLSQHNGIDYQSQMASLAAATISIALSVRAVFTGQVWKKTLLLGASILLGWLYLTLVEYAIGFEVFRIASLFLLSYRIPLSPMKRIWAGIKYWMPNIFIPFVFIVWRFFFFQAERSATDVNLQFEQVKLYPIQTIYHWTVQVLLDMFDVIFGAWVIPLSQLTGYIQSWGGILAFIVASMFILFAHFQNSSRQENLSPKDFTNEALILGLVITIGGLIPIAMVNREVSFPAFSRYSLVSSAGVGLFFAALLMRLRIQALQNGIAAILVLISILTHHANSVKAAQASESMNTFWWQVAWRVPQLAKNATLIVNYPGAVIEEDYFIWGPANLIYFPDKQNPDNIQPGVYAVLLNEDTIEKVHARERQVYDKRKTITTYANYRNILVITQPGINSCVHVMDGIRPEYSVGESDLVRQVGAYSEIEHVLADEAPHTPSTVVFGPEPDHGWCFFYQRADLARQRGEWNQVLEIGEQAFGQGFEPEDPIEWMPFLQAYAMIGNIERLTESASKITSNPYISLQACEIINAMPDVPANVVDTVDSLYCLE